MSYKVVNCKTRQILITGLSQFDAQIHASELNAAFPHIRFAAGRHYAK